ncbi:MAG: hypothetical protein ACI35O_16935 [Bacillaceae bacterium]
MSKRVRIELKPIIYIDLPVENESDELTLLKSGYEFTENNIAKINIEVIQNDGTVHIGRADDWKIGEYEIIDED